MGEIIILIYDMMNYYEVHEIPGLLLTVDFEKVFVQ